MVGKAKGRSITASISLLPAKSSRISTQATRRPKTALTQVTPIATVRVTRKDSRAAVVVMAAQNPLRPPLADCHTTAASGSSTITLSQIDAVPARTGVERSRRTPYAAAVIRWLSCRWW